MPAASRPKNSTRNPAAHIGAAAYFTIGRKSSAGTSCTGTCCPTVIVAASKKNAYRVSRIEIAPEHQRTAGRQGEIVDPERELQIGRAALVEHQRGADHRPAVPHHAEGEDDRHQAIEHLEPALDSGPQQAQHQIGAHVRVHAHQLARDDHHRPDRDVDYYLLGPGDRRTRGDVAAKNLKRGDRHRKSAEQADQHALDPIPDCSDAG